MTAAGFSAPSIGTGGLGVTTATHTHMAEVRAGVVRHSMRGHTRRVYSDGTIVADVWDSAGPLTAREAIESRTSRLLGQGREPVVDREHLTVWWLEADGDVTVTTTLTYSAVTA